MRRYFLFTYLFFTLSAPCQDLKRTVITDPSISRRCNALLEKRNKKITLRQRLQALLLRNERLTKIAPLEKITVRKKLKKSYGRLNNELRLINTKILNQEENLVRKGCPGIRL
jgi:hypothetical protein